MLGRIARSSMEELAAFLTSPSVAPELRRRPATRKWQWLTRRTRHPKRRKYSACTHIACSAQPLIANPSFAQRLRDKALLAYCRAVPALL
jgi:hypothetical protein